MTLSNAGNSNDGRGVTEPPAVVSITEAPMPDSHGGRGEGVAEGGGDAEAGRGDGEGEIAPGGSPRNIRQGVVCTGQK